jgi:lipoprotein-releasing system permease protein
VEGPVMVVHDSLVSPAYIKSVGEDGDDPVFPMKKYITEGTFELRGDSVIVGAGWARENNAKPGDTLQIYGPAQFAGLRNHKAGEPISVALPQEPTIRGVMLTNQSTYDDGGILLSTSLGQEIYNLGDSVQGIAIRLKDPDDASKVRDELNSSIPMPLQAYTWEDQHQDLFSALALERIVMSGILFLITIVSAFGVGNTLITVTVQKAREIGLMKALGASDTQICLLFTCHGFIVGTLGALIGVVIGLSGLYVRNDVRHLLFSGFDIHPVSETIYALPEVPAVINPVQIVVVAVASILVCTLAAFVPAIVAAKMPPARALRSE